jgi:biopolymer transport protein ExbD
LSRFREPEVGEAAGELNVIPYLDIIMNIVVFIMATLSVVFMSTIATTPPSVGGGRATRAPKTKSLKLSALITSDGVALKTSTGNIAQGCDRVGAGITVPMIGNDHDYAEITRCARELKRLNERFAKEKQVTITANPEVSYQVLIHVIDALREDDKGELFPTVYFGVAR